MPEAIVRNTSHHRVKASFEETMSALGTYLDLYLIHASLGAQYLLTQCD